MSDVACTSGYLGEAGCRLSLFVSPGEGPAAGVSRRDGGYAWRNHDRRYRLLGDRLPPERLQVIATVLAELTRDLAPLGPDFRQQLIASRANSAPCLV